MRETIPCHRIKTRKRQYEFNDGGAATRQSPENEPMRLVAEDPMSKKRHRIAHRRLQGGSSPAAGCPGYRYRLSVS